MPPVNKIWSPTTTAWGTAGNWSPSGVPAATDPVMIPARAGYAIAAYDASAVASGGLTIEDGYAYAIGTSAGWLKFDAATYVARVGGLAQQFLDLRNASNIIVTSTGGAPGTNQYGLNLIGLDNDALTVKASGGSVGVASQLGEVFEAAAINIAAGDVYLGRGVVAKDGASAFPLTIDGGSVVGWSPLTTAIVNAGSYTHWLGAVTSLTVRGGTVYHNAVGAITNLYVTAGGKVDFSQVYDAVTVTNCYLYAGASLYDPRGRVTWTNPIQLVQTDQQSVTMNLGKNRKYTVANI